MVVSGHESKEPNKCVSIPDRSQATLLGCWVYCVKKHNQLSLNSVLHTGATELQHSHMAVPGIEPKDTSKCLFPSKVHLLLPKYVALTERCLNPHQGLVLYNRMWRGSLLDMSQKSRTSVRVHTR